MKRTDSASRPVPRRSKFLMALYPLFIVLCTAAVVLVAFSGSRKIDYVITDGNNIYSVSSYSQDISRVLEECGISGEGVSYTTEKQGQAIGITVLRPATVSVECDGKSNFIAMNGGTVGDALAKLGITLNEGDIISESTDAPISDGMKITVSRMDVEFSTAEKIISCGTTYVADDTLEAGATEVVTAGTDGLLRVTYKRTSVNGVLSGFDVSSEETVKEPVDAVVRYGTKVPVLQAETLSAGSGSSAQSSDSASGSGAASSSSPASVSSPASEPSPSSSGSSSGSSSSGGRSAVSNGQTATVAASDSGSGTVTTASGETFSYSKVISMTATAYYGGGTTSSGAPAQVGIVAALPGVIPAGTRVYIVSPYGSWEYGVAVVGDTPGINVVDLYMDTYEECIQFGMRDALVYILG